MDESEFTVFFHRVFPGLLRYVSRMTDHTVAEDICADTMVTLWRKHAPPAIDESTHERLTALTYRIAQGHIRNHQRSVQRRDALVDRLVSRPPVDDPDLAARLIIQDEISHCLEPLTPENRLLLALVIDEFSTSEIAGILGCSADAVKMRLHRLRRLLRESLAIATEESDADQSST